MKIWNVTVFMSNGNTLDMRIEAATKTEAMDKAEERAEEMYGGIATVQDVDCDMEDA